jgi:hypothetical protein
MSVTGFLASTNGRIARGAAGVALIVLGIALGGGWWALAVIGLFPLAAGIFDICLSGPLVRLPLAVETSAPARNATEPGRVKSPVGLRGGPVSREAGSGQVEPSQVFEVGRGRPGEFSGGPGCWWARAGQ